MKISRAGLIVFTLMATTLQCQAFDSDGDHGWGAPYNSHLDPYDGHPLGPPLPALPPGYDYYDRRLIRLPYADLPRTFAPTARRLTRARHGERPTRGCRACASAVDR